jgi:hypothetical protein
MIFFTYDRLLKIRRAAGLFPLLLPLSQAGLRSSQKACIVRAWMSGIYLFPFVLRKMDLAQLIESLPVGLHGHAHTSQ